MLNENILDAENLYRRVSVNPNSWDLENNKPSSAAFKQSTGVSVDRAGEGWRET